MSSVYPDDTKPSTAAHRGRVAFVVTSMHGGGAEAVGRTWMNWFVENGYSVSAILVSDKPGSELLHPAVVVHRDAAHGSHVSKVRALRSIIEIGGYDAVVGLQTYPNLLALAARGRRRTWPRVIIAEHNLITPGLPGSSLSNRVKVALARRWYRHADVVTSASHAVGAEMTAAFGVPGSRSLVVPNPAAAKAAHAVRVDRTPGSDNGIQLVLACRLVPQKSPHLAIETAQALERRGIATEVVSFGGGPLERELTALAKKRGIRFTAHGWVEDWFERFASNSVVVLPSHREGLGNVLIEAAAHGVPSVAVSTALGVVDAIVPGVTGELALDDDPESIADAVVRAAELPVTDIDAWLHRFSEDSSGSMLEAAIAYAQRRPRAA